MRWTLTALAAALLSASVGCGGSGPTYPHALQEYRCGLTRYVEELDAYAYHPPFTFCTDRDYETLVVLHDGTEVWGDEAGRINAAWWDVWFLYMICVIDPPSEWDGWWWWDWERWDYVWVPERT